MRSQRSTSVILSSGQIAKVVGDRKIELPPLGSILSNNVLGKLKIR